MKKGAAVFLGLSTCHQITVPMARRAEWSVLPFPVSLTTLLAALPLGNSLTGYYGILLRSKGTRGFSLAPIHNRTKPFLCAVPLAFLSGAYVFAAYMKRCVCISPSFFQIEPPARYHSA